MGKKLTEAEKKAKQDKIKEITDKLEAGVNEIFESGKYAEYLKTMSRFHRYSFRLKCQC